jgi:REP element-mobilizing transposase RayT
MPRQLRLQYPGAMYHVMSRGDRREKIFLDDVDRQDFIKTLAEACQKTGWQVHAYCLMPNHYHLVLETPEPNLVAGMAWLQSSYTIRLNHRHQLFGHVFRFEKWMERRRAEETDPEAQKALRRGWCLGSSGFKREMLFRMESGLGEHHSGELRQGSAEAKAERIVAEELKRLGWKEADLKSRRKNDPDKLEIGARLRRETTLTIKAIAARVCLGTSKAANAKLHRHMREGAKPRKGKARPAGRRT